MRGKRVKMLRKVLGRVGFSGVTPKMFRLIKRRWSEASSSVGNSERLMIQVVKGAINE